ncbi:MAG: folate family ECF transporter S component [Ruminococcaceae bacterium]|nr:folate family ECF transporter S component [Oscillospiraceae bacterium]
MGMLITMYVVLDRFAAFKSWNLKIALSFIPLVIAATLLGPVKSTIIGGIGDFIAATLFPFGPYFPGYTLTCTLKGLVYGILLYKKVTFPRVLLAAFINEFILSLLLTSYWIYFTSGNAVYMSIVYSRFIQVIPLFIIQIPIILAMDKAIFSRIKSEYINLSTTEKKKV